MYKVVKEEGYYNTVIVINTETNTNIDIGTVSSEVIKIITDGGVDIPSESMHDLLYSKWDFVVNSDVAHKLVGLAFKVKKPIRDQRKRKPELSEIIAEDKAKKDKINADTDMFDMIFGIE